MDSSLTDNEKRFVLAEMIKVSQIDIIALVEFVKHYDVQPDWLSMQLPNGRNMNQCMRAAQSLGIVHLQPPFMPAIKRKSLGDLNEPMPKRIAIAPIEPPPIAYQRNVNIQPRPSPNGFSATHPIASPTVPPASIGKKRGRPSKADKEAQARANASSSFAHVLAPAPLAPHPAAPAQQDYSPNTTGAYHVSSGPVDPKSRKRGSMAPSIDKSQPRGLPEISQEGAEKSPALSNLISTPTPENHASRDSPAVHETGRNLSGSIPQHHVPTAVMVDPVRKETHPPATPATPVNTTA